MQDCEACGERLPADAVRCPGCGAAVAPAPEASVGVPTRFGSDQAQPDTWPTQPEFDPPEHEPMQPSAPEAEPDSPDFDPDETSHFQVGYASRRTIKNNVALVAIAVALVAAVSSLAWLIGQTVGSRSNGGTQPTVSASPTVLSTTPPRGSVVCTTEVTRSDNTTCVVATRVLSAVRRLGTDLPSTFRVTIESPQTNKNVTFVCRIKSWIVCSAKDDIVVNVMRQA